MTWLPGLKPVRSQNHHDGSGDSWFTPRAIVDAAAEAMGSIDLDPCAHPAAPVWQFAKHKIAMCEGGDGLVDPWPGVGGVWCNPPYSDVAPWLKRCRAAAESRPVIMMIPTRPETKAWSTYVLNAGACIVQQVGRVRFVGLDGQTHGNGMVTTCFVTWSVDLARKLRQALQVRNIAAHVLRVDNGANDAAGSR